MTTTRTHNEIASKIASDAWAMATLHIDEDADFETTVPEEVQKIEALVMVHIARMALADIATDFWIEAPAMIEVDDDDTDLNN